MAGRVSAFKKEEREAGPIERRVGGAGRRLRSGLVAIEWRGRRV